jgi:hypothetical protein
MADTFTPDIGQRIDAQGRVTYDFDAHVRARGVDFDAGDGLNAPDDRRIRWLRQSDGAAVAQILAYDVPLGDSVSLQLEVDKPAGVTQAFIGLTAGPVTSVLLKDDGASNFLQLNDTQALYAAIGQATFLAVPAGNSNVVAGVPWTHAHTGAAILSVVPSGAYGFTILPRVSAVGAITFVITGNPALQDITVNWLTFGN